MNDKLWNILEKPNSYTHIKDDDVCIYAREYVTGGYGYKGGPTNQLIINFKKAPPLKINTSKWKYRENAVKQFKEDIEILLESTSQAVITSIPSSKKKNHPEYNNRFEDLFKEILKSHSQWIIEWPVEIKKTISASRCQGNRDPKSIKKNYFWRGFKNKPPEELYIFDDVLVSGAHFRAISDFLKENNYTGKIIGVFWAKAVYQNIKKSSE